MKHHDLMNECVREFYDFVGYDKGRIFKRIVGRFLSIRGDKRVYNFGIKGQCDLHGWVSYNNKAYAFEVEVKLKRDRLREGQKNYKKMCQKMGVGWFEYRDKDRFREELKNWFREVRFGSEKKR